MLRVNDVNSRGLETLRSPIQVTTSPALMPAFSAGESLSTDRTSTPDLTPKYCASCVSIGSQDMPNSPLFQTISGLGISGMGNARTSGNSMPGNPAGNSL